MASLSSLHLRLHVLLFLLLAFAAALSVVVVVVATDHIVGGDLGWNPNINYSLWSDNQTFFAGDLISFRYQKNTYDVFEVNRTGYENCTMDGVAGNWSSGKDFIPLQEPKTYYFICGRGFCFSGMRVAAVVRPLPSNSSSAAAAAAAPENSAAAAAKANLRVWAAATATAAAAAGVLGWI